MSSDGNPDCILNHHLEIEQRQTVVESGFLQGSVDQESYTIQPEALYTMCALNYLQASKSAWIPRQAIDSGMTFHLNFFCEEVKHIVQCVTCRAEHIPLFQHPYNSDPSLIESDFEAANAALDSDPMFFTSLKYFAYTIWPICINSHWVVIILHQTNHGNISLIDHVVIVDSERNMNYHTYPDFAWKRLKKIFTLQRGFAFAHPQPQELWTTFQNDPFSCGLRVYEVVKVILLRINEAFHQGVPGAYDDSIWADLSVDFQPDKVRAELIGILAYETLRFQNFDARICITPFAALKRPHTTNGTIQRGSDEAQLMHPYLWPAEIPRHIYDASDVDDSAAVVLT